MPRKKENNDRISCGMIMPISSYGTYSAEFWADVRVFLETAIKSAGLEPVPAWENDANDIIHAKIIENIAAFPVMIGVIIGCNPNVMIECGMRLWTNKPILLLHGETERIPFDVGSISCLSFPIDFHYFKLDRLKSEIAERLNYMTSTQYKTFKSYYELPREVETPKENQKIDFPQFVSEIRREISSLKCAMMKCQQQVESATGFTSQNKPLEFSSMLSGNVYPYQIGTSGLSWSTIRPTQPIDQFAFQDERRCRDASEEKEQQ